MRVLVQVHAKPPRPGRSKTRLGAEIGPELAADVAQAMLSDTFALLARVPEVEVVLCTPEPTADHGVDAVRWDQGQGDLGERLERAFRRGLATHDAVVALGADAPGLPERALRGLIALLTTADAAMGPAEDGGFWGLGLRRCPMGTLAGLPWSTRGTAAATAARLPGLVFGEGWWDVDVAADLRRVRDEVSPDTAPATHALLSRLPC